MKPGPRTECSRPLYNYVSTIFPRLFFTQYIERGIVFLILREGILLPTLKNCCAGHGDAVRCG